MRIKLFDRGIESLRQPDRHPRCYELTDDERLSKIREWNNRNIWNDSESSNHDLDKFYKDQNAT